MSKQLTLGTGFEKLSRTTKRAKFLAEMERIVPWAELCRLIAPKCPASTGIRRGTVLSFPERHFLQPRWAAHRKSTHSGGIEMAAKRGRDVEKSYPRAKFVEKLRRLADAMENGERFAIQIAGERVFVPAKAIFNIEHERSGEEEEIEFQIKWARE